MVENISTEDANLFVGYQIPASKNAVQEVHVKEHNRREASGPIEPDQFLMLAGQRRDAQSIDRAAW
jgi:hypothetical protein